MHQMMSCLIRQIERFHYCDSADADFTQCFQRPSRYGSFSIFIITQLRPIDSQLAFWRRIPLTMLGMTVDELRAIEMAIAMAATDDVQH